MSDFKMKPNLCPIAVHVINTTESSGAQLKNNGYAHMIACVASMRELAFDRYMLSLWKNSRLDRYSRWKK